MNPLFDDGGAFADLLQRVVGPLEATEMPHLLFLVADDEAVRQAVTAETAERLTGRYSVTELDYAEASLPDLLRSYRQQAPHAPVCVFVQGLDVLKRRDPTAYRDALRFLNAHREDLRLRTGALILWLTPEVWDDVLRDAPDVADWGSCERFVLPGSTP